MSETIRPASHTTPSSGQPRPPDPREHPRMLWLRAAVAEGLGMPALLCRGGDCRRDGRCLWVEIGTRLPSCLAGATPAQRAVYDATLALLLTFDAKLRPGMLAQWHGRFGTGEILERQRLCLDILFALLPADDPLRAEFRAFWRRETVPVGAWADKSQGRGKGRGSIECSQGA